MLSRFDASYFEAEARMLLSSPTIDGLVVTSSPSHFATSSKLKELVISDPDVMRTCITSLSYYGSLSVRHIQDSVANDEATYLVFAGCKNGAAEASELTETMTGSEFAATDRKIEHLNISQMDVDPMDVASALGIGRVKSLDLSRLELDDSSVDVFASGGYFRNLKWLDLSGNSNITYVGVLSIADAVSRGRFPVLKWLDLMGTDCDATPYIDGYTWRMTQVSKGLADRFGHQPWMMLGSRIRGMEGRELLSKEDREIPPNKFRLP